MLGKSGEPPPIYDAYNGIVEVSGSIPLGSTNSARAWPEMARPFVFAGTAGEPPIWVASAKLDLKRSGFRDNISLQLVLSGSLSEFLKLPKLKR